MCTVANFELSWELDSEPYWGLAENILVLHVSILISTKHKVQPKLMGILQF